MIMTKHTFINKRPFTTTNRNNVNDDKLEKIRHDLIALDKQIDQKTRNIESINHRLNDLIQDTMFDAEEWNRKQVLSASDTRINRYGKLGMKLFKMRKESETNINSDDCNTRKMEVEKEKQDTRTGFTDFSGSVLRSFMPAERQRRYDLILGSRWKDEKEQDKFYKTRSDLLKKLKNSSESKKDS